MTILVFEYLSIYKFIIIMKNKISVVKKEW